MTLTFKMSFRVLLVMVFAGCALTDFVQLDSCSLRDTTTNEILSLGGLAKKDKTAAVSAKDSTGQYDYLYNPCLSFTAEPSTQCDNVAMCQEDTGHQPIRYYNLGNQSTATFLFENNYHYIQYTGSEIFEGGHRTAIVQLLCDETAVEPKLLFISEAEKGTYRLVLQSECACFGKCKQVSQTCTPQSGNCACELDTGELINIRSLNQPSAPMVVKTPTSTVTLNPCTGINVGPGADGCRDVTVCVQNAGTYTDYGVASRAAYTLQNGHVILTYISQDSSKRTNIELVCDPGQRHYPLVTIQGQQTPSEINLELRSVCACPNACFNPPVNCDRIDDCSCRLDDGNGVFSLSNLDNPAAPFLARGGDKWSNYTYYYNPCTPFTPPEPNDNCTAVAGCQLVDGTNEDFSIGAQNTASFRVSTAESDVLTMMYTGGNEDRQTFVQLECNATKEIPFLRYVYEEPIHAYHFVLESKDSCPKPEMKKPGNAKSQRPRTRL